MLCAGSLTSGHIVCSTHGKSAPILEVRVKQKRERERSREREREGEKERKREGEK